MKLEFIDHNTYKELDFEAIFDELHNDVYRKYGKIINANSYIKIAWSSDPITTSVFRFILENICNRD